MGHGPVSGQELLTAISRRPMPSIRASLVVGFAAAVLWLGARLLITRHAPPHEPWVHDEFVYLLQADTFLHGRLANPPHPMGRFFESPHVLIQPTYASKYPPGEAAWLALGKVLCGSTYAGLILQGVCLVFVLGLMFCAWTRLPAAMLMTFVAGCSLLPPVISWTRSYWGAGSAAGIGAAFVLLGLGCFLRGGRTLLPGLAMGFGAIQLFFTRPYEGGVLCLAVLACAPWLTPRSNPRSSRNLLRLAASAGAVLLAGLAWNAYYDKAVTGHAFELPYMLHDKTYNTAPVFCFLPMKPEPKYSSDRLAAQHGLHGWEADKYRESCSHRLWPIYTSLDVGNVVATMLLPVLPVFLLFPLSWRNARCRALLLISAACVFSVVLEVWHFSHYLAPAFVAMLLYCACSLDDLAGLPGLSARNRRAMAVELVLVTLAYLGVQLHAHPWTTNSQAFGFRRAQLLHQLAERNGQQLVVVRYPDPNACVIYEWVYNGADPDSQKVVFAHDRGPVEDRALFDYYKARTKWLLIAHCDDYQLQPLPD